MEQKRKGSIPVVAGLVSVLGVLGVASVFMTNSSARVEKSATLNYMTQEMANAALEETLVKVQNGSATWDNNDDNVKLSFAPAATLLMYSAPGVKISPVSVFARKIIDKGESNMRDRFYSQFAALPNFDANHDPQWESKVTGPLAKLGAVPQGVNIDTATSQKMAQSWAGSVSDDALRTALNSITPLAAGRDHSNDELAPVLAAINGNTFGDNSSSTLSQAAPGAAKPAAPKAPSNSNVPKPANAASADNGLNAIAQATGNNGCGASTPANQAQQALAAGANGVGRTPPGGLGQAASDQQSAGNLIAIDSNNNFVRLIDRLSKRGGVFKHQPYLLTVDAEVEASLGFGMTARRKATAQRVVGEYQYSEAVNFIFGRLVKYIAFTKNLTVNDLYAMGFITNTTAPEIRFDNMFPLTALSVPYHSRQVWPFEVANHSATF